eukprot:2935534-Prymnesium_polylepis.1
MLRSALRELRGERARLVLAADQASLTDPTVRASFSARAAAAMRDRLAPYVAGRSVALLLTGEAFRSARGGRGDAPCNTSSVDAQREATESYVRQIVLPLELAGASVEVLFVFPRCSSERRTNRLAQMLVGWLGRERVHQWWPVTTH